MATTSAGTKPARARTGTASRPRARATTPASARADGSAKRATGTPSAARGKAAKPTTTPAAEAKPERVKLVRDGFTMPKADYELIAALKARALRLGQEVKKSELLRAGLHLLAGADDAGFGVAVAAVPRLKTGRPHQKKK